ncbi:fimbrial protein [Cronobacter malonaticus]|uniref:fimbrial protein n=1 Tax=Cronobacter malonaticus TaxID=413503 RepID=UPI0029C9C144|nr:fimbrial protein [Cronobacter malonaticus]
MKIFNFLPGIVLSLAAVTSTSAVAAEDNVHFSGALVSQPCTLPDADSDIKLDFGSVIIKSLYKYQRTMGKAFTIHLQDCDPSVFNSVNVTFEGTADAELTDMLALDAVSTAKGVAIGFELTDGTPLAINKAGPFSSLISGDNSLTFNAYVQAKPTAIATQTLGAGDFTAISTFVLGYQ